MVRFDVTFMEMSRSITMNFENNNDFDVSFGAVIETPVIPSNYGLITWDGSSLTVS